MDLTRFLPIPGVDRPHLDNRGASSAVGHIVALGMISLLIIGFYASMPAATQGADIAQRNQMQTEGQKLSGQIAAVDRLVRSSNSDGQIGRHITLSDRIGNQQYTISVKTTDSGDQYLLLETVSSGMTVKIPIKTETPVDTTTVEGGDIYIVRYDGATNLTLVSED